ncbi:MAG: aminotransferase class V-fold PLP-dependent enzyme [Acidobacteriaceae bacterium]
MKRLAADSGSLDNGTPLSSPAPESTLARIYLNNAAQGWPKAPGVPEAVLEALRQPPPSAGRAAGNSHDPAAECRNRITRLLDLPDPSRSVLTSGATHALNLAIGGLALARGATVVTTVAEHNSVLRPLFRLQDHRQIRVVLVGLDASGDLDRDDFERALRSRPVLVAITHASNVTGRVFNAGTLLRLARDAGAVTLLDASQTLGLLQVHPRELSADLVAFPGHKGLHGPSGSGALYVASHLQLQPLMVGGTGHLSHSRMHPSEMPERLEAGTPNAPALAGWAAALRWRDSFAEPFTQNSREAGRRLREGLRRVKGVHLFGDAPPADSIGVCSFRIDGWAVDDAGMALQESFGIACRTGLHCAPLIHEALGTAGEGTIRMSVSGFNQSDEIDAALAAVAHMAAK